MGGGGRGRRADRGAALAVGLLTFVCLSPALFGEFLNWDDDVNFLNNTGFRGLGPANLMWMFTDLWGHYIPITWLTLGLDYVVWGLNPFGYHLTSLVIHSLNAVLFYRVVHVLLCWRAPSSTHAIWAAAAAALFFSIHPLRVESVAWATERRDVLCGLFFLLSLLFYLRARREPRTARRWLVLSVACFGLSLLSKAAGLLLPAVLLVLDAYPLRRFSGRPAQVRSIAVEKSS